MQVGFRDKRNLHGNAENISPENNRFNKQLMEIYRKTEATEKKQGTAEHQTQSKELFKHVRKLTKIKSTLGK